MLNSDQRTRLKLLRNLGNYEKKVALQALEDNFWDTSEANLWLKTKASNPDITLEEFHKQYDENKNKSAAIMPQDRYDLEPSKKEAAGSNRASRRAAKKKKK